MLQRICNPLRSAAEPVGEEATHRTQERHSTSARSTGLGKTAVNATDDPVVVHRFELDVPTEPVAVDRQSPQVKGSHYLQTDGLSDFLSPLQSMLV